MAMWGRMPFPLSLPTPSPQEPWEAQDYAHRDRSRVNFSFCERPCACPRVCTGNRILEATTMQRTAGIKNKIRTRIASREKGSGTVSTRITTTGGVL